MSTEIMKLRMQGRHHAEQMLELVGVDEMEPHVKHGFYMAIVMKAKELYPPPNENPMTADEAKAFEREQIDFGVYKGRTYGQVPRDYLEWVADKSLDIRRYLRRGSC